MLHERCENLPVGRTEAQNGILHATHLRPDEERSSMFGTVTRYYEDKGYGVRDIKGIREEKNLGRKTNQQLHSLPAYSARTAHPFQRNGAPFRFKLSKTQQVD